MPRISICGMNPIAACALRNRLFFDPNLFFGKRWIFDIVIEIVKSDVVDICCDGQPFLLLAYTPSDTAKEEIIEILNTNGFEFEMTELKEFVAIKKKPTPKTVFATIWERPLGVTAGTLVSLFGDQSSGIGRDITCILKQLVKEKIIRKTANGLYKANAKQLQIFLEKYAKTLSQTCL